jgi:lipoyl(octanoyl) transferase
MALLSTWLGRVDCAQTIEQMQAFTANRDDHTPDALWLCEHHPVFTLGLAAKPEHLLAPGDIPVLPTNRGGQVTYHGPGQVVAYPLINLQRAGFYIKAYVHKLEEALIRTLWHFGVVGHRVAGAPGIYVRLDKPFDHALLPQRPQHRPVGSPPLEPDFTGVGKIAAVGIKVSRHCTYHGVSLNVNMDLTPFLRINPCGYAGLPTVDLSTMGIQTGVSDVAQLLSQELSLQLSRSSADPHHPTPTQDAP